MEMQLLALLLHSGITFWINFFFLTVSVLVLFKQENYGTGLLADLGVKTAIQDIVDISHLWLWPKILIFSVQMFSFFEFF